MKVCLQAGHSGTYVGATGAPGERDWNEKVVPLIAKILNERGVETYETNANGYQDSVVTDTDWDLFLAVHYDADIYGEGGGFCDYPDASTDYAHEESKRICDVINNHYFKITGIPYKPSRSNANTKFYYMWQYLTANTPCNLIECGVGWRKPEDYETLHNRIDVVAKAIADGISLALGIDIGMTDCEQKLIDKENELIEMRQSRNEWKRKYGELEDKYAANMKEKNDHIEALQKTVSELNQINSSLMKDKDTLIEDKNALETKVGVLEEELSMLDGLYQAQVEDYNKLLSEYAELETQLAECKKKYRTKLCKISWTEFAKTKLKGCK